MFKIKSQTAPSFINELFSHREHAYNMRDNDQFTLPKFNTVTFGRKSFRYYGSKLWTNIPVEIKQKPSLSTFKSAITKWVESIADLQNLEFI